MQDDTQMTLAERRKYLGRMRPRYLLADRAEQSRLLDELEAVTGMQRKSLLRLLHASSLARHPRTTQRGKTYGAQVADAIRLIWERFIADTCTKEEIPPDQLTLHADRGSAMTSKSVAQLLADLGVTKTHSRPHVSNDNPYSEAQFKTLKYRPGFPAQFGSLADARAWARPFFQWYNHDHHHSGIGLLTPATVHRGHAAEMITARQQVLTTAYQAHPERFVRGAPTPPVLPTAVWINPPSASDPGTDRLLIVPGRPLSGEADTSQPIFLKFRPELSQMA